jgi:transcriptional regulator with XRE-family HTH domain
MTHRRNTAYDKQLGNRLRQLRLTRGMSQTVLGDALGITFQQIQKYENGTNAIASTRIPALCKVLGINPEELYKADTQTEAVSGVSSSALKTAQRLERLRSKQRMAVWTVINAFEKENANGRGGKARADRSRHEETNTDHRNTDSDHT